MDGKDKSLLRLMDGSDNRFIIPVYQRNYDWGFTQCQQLFNDLIDIVKNDRATHFFGCVVRCQQKGGGADEYLIIDGQQRMTTVCLIFLAIYWNILKGNLEPEDPKLAEKIYKKFLVDEFDTRDKKIRLKLNKEDRDAFDHLVDCGEGNDYANSRVVTNYDYFYKRMQDLPFAVDNILDAIRKLIVIDIFLDDDDDAQLIFESLNSTGLELTEADKIRNFVLMGLSEKEQEDYYTKYWSYIEKYCAGNQTLDNFIRDYLTLKSPTGEIPNFKKIYPAFKAFAEGKKMELILAEMKVYSEFYNKIRSSNVGSAEANEIMGRLNYLEMTVTYPYLLGFLGYVEDNHIDNKEVCDVLSCLEVFIFRRMMCGYPTNALNKVFATLHQQILKNKKKSDSYYSVLVYLLQNRRKTVIFPKDDEFIRDFTTKAVYNFRSKNRSYLFDRLENGSSKEKNDVIRYIQKGELSVEHIMPQTLTSAWQEALGEDYFRVHEEWLHTIANLTLTGYNSQYSNRPFSEKKVIENGFQQSGLRLNHYIAQFDKWTEEEMILRRDKLAEMAKSIWAYPETSYQPDVRMEDEVPIGDEDFSYSNRRITSFRLLGTPYAEDEWTSAMVTILQLLYELDPKFLIAETKNKDNVWLVPKDPENRYPHKQIADGIWVNTASDTNTKIRIIRNIYRNYDLADDDLVFTLAPEKPKEEGLLFPEATTWLLPSNNSFFRIDDCINDKGVVYWRQYNNFSAGDFVYLYGTKPESRIKYLMRIDGADLQHTDEMDDKEYWISAEEYANRSFHNRYAKLTLVRKFDTDVLSLDNLLQHGLNGAPQGAIKISAELLEYIESQ